MTKSDRGWLLPHFNHLLRSTFTVSQKYNYRAIVIGFVGLYYNVWRKRRTMSLTDM